MEIFERQGCALHGNELWIENLPLSAIARTCSTPVYVYSETVLENNMRAFKQGMKSEQFQTEVIFASKAFNVIEMIRLAQKEGLWLDCVSLGEMATARQAGFDMSHVVLHGSAKSETELDYAFENGVGTLVCDSLGDARRIADAASRHPEKSCRVLLRINPGVEAHTHDYITTARPDSKFGIYKDRKEEILASVQTMTAQSNLSFAGFHAHIGSQIFALEAFAGEIEVLGEFCAWFEQETGLAVRVLDLGGGFAAYYTEQDEPIAIDVVCQTILDTCAKITKQHDLGLEGVWIEPGRSIVANAGLTLYTIEHRKETEGKTWLFTDGGMNDNIRPALYQAEYSCDLVSRMDEEKTEEVTVSGKCCESGDIVVPHAKLPVARQNDLLAVYATGAYGYSMASQYNKLFVPPVVFVKGDQARFVVRPQTIEDLLAREGSWPLEIA